jgi:hypothetical protein
MINDRPRVIHLTKRAESGYDEGRAGATITPGMLIALNSSGVYVPHASADAIASPTFAIEDALQGNTIDDNYASGDLTRMIHAVTGDHVLAILEAGANVTDGTKLTSNGAGYLQSGDADSDAVAVALEDRDASASDVTLEERRIRVRIL